MIEYQEPLTGAQVAKEIGISRQAVSASLRRSMMKLYHKVLKEGYAETPSDAVLFLMRMLNVHNGSAEEIKSFIKLFDKKIIESIKVNYLINNSL